MHSCFNNHSKQECNKSPRSCRYVTSDNRVVHGYGAVGRMKIGTGNRITRRHTVAMPLFRPQITCDLTWDRARAEAIGNLRLTASFLPFHRPYRSLQEPDCPGLCQHSASPSLPRSNCNHYSATSCHTSPSVHP
jgi:hypothetical protein